MPVLRVSVNLVQLDAVVTDHKGRQVTNLTADDFQVFQDGKQQKITHFSYISAAANTPATPLRPLPRESRFAGAPIPPPVKLRTDQVRRTFAMVVDDLGLSFESSAQIRKMLNTFVDKQMQPGDLAAIIRTGSGIGAFQQSSSQQPPPRGHRPGKIQRLPPDRLRWRRRPGNGFRNQYFTMGTIAAINFVIAGLKDMPGRKAMRIGAEPSSTRPRPGGVEEDDGAAAGARAFGLAAGCQIEQERFAHEHGISGGAGGAGRRAARVFPAEISDPDYVRGDADCRAGYLGAAAAQAARGARSRSNRRRHRSSSPSRFV